MLYRIEGLEADQVNMIAKALGELPFKEAAPVIANITQQVQAQEAAKRKRVEDEAAKASADAAADKAVRGVIQDAREASDRPAPEMLPVTADEEDDAVAAANWPPHVPAESDPESFEAIREQARNQPVKRVRR